MDIFGPRKVAAVGAVIAAIGMFSTSFVRRVELLYLTYGVTLGIGSSLLMTPSLLIPSHYFDKKLGLANGISTFGNALFAATLPFLLVKLLARFELNTFMILSGFYVVSFFATLTYRTRTKVKSGWRCARGRSLIDRKIWRNRKYVIWLVAVILNHFTMYVPIMHLVSVDT